MIKNFKTFRLLTESSTSENLIDQIDDDFIEKYYDEHYDISLSEVIEMSSHDDIMDYFNEDKYKKDWIEEFSRDYSFSEFDTDDLKLYIKKKLDDKKENKIIEIYNRNNYDEDDEDSEKETEYNSYMLDNLDKDELQEVIEDRGEEDNCAEWIIDGWYSGQNGKDIFDEMCGWAIKNGKYGEYEYGSFKEISSSKLYKRVSNYIDDTKLKQNWKDGEDFDHKKETVKGDIWDSPILQRYLIKEDPDNAEALTELWSKNNGKNIGNEYNFQKAYINKYLKDNMDEKEENDDEEYKTIDDEEEDEEYKTTLIEDSLGYLHKKFGVNDKIADEYEPYMWKITAQYKYNL